MQFSLLLAASPALQLAPLAAVAPPRLEPPVMRKLSNIVREMAPPRSDPVIHHTGVPEGDKFSGASVPFAPLGTSGSGSTASPSSLRGNSGGPQVGDVKVLDPMSFRPSGGPQQQRAAAAAAASEVAGGVEGAAREGAAGSLVDKKNVITRELGLSGNLPTVAAVAAAELGVDATGKKAAQLIDECHRQLVDGALVDKKNAIADELGLSGDLTAVAADAADELDIDATGKGFAQLIDEAHESLFG